MSATVRAANGLVASGHPLATAAGLAALRDGGSAADAAIAAAAVCTVTLPDATTVGGDMFALVYDARTRSVSAYNASGAAPRSLEGPERFGAAFPRGGAIVATVPGVVAGWADLLADHGRFGLDRALAPAIAYAAEGFPVAARLADAFASSAERLAADEGCARTFLPRGRPLAAGEMLQQPDLARTLAAIAREGADCFYRGELAERIARGIRALGGAIDADDLAAHATDRPAPLCVPYRGFQVFGQPPVSQGHVFLEELAIVGGFDLAALGLGTAELVHLLVEAKKLAFADRDCHAGDPRVSGFDASRLLDPAFLAARRAAIGPRAADHPAAAPLGGDTTYLATVDRDGNAVSLIESCFTLFGAGVMISDTGVVLSNRLTSFSLDPRSPNVLRGGKRPIHTLNTALVLEDGSPRLVFGTPGLHAQVQTNLQLAVALLDFGLDPQRAIDEPRWHHTTGRTLQIEARASDALRSGLAARGHRLEPLADWSPVTGGAQVVAVERNGTFAGGADSRRDGHVAGY